MKDKRFNKYQEKLVTLSRDYKVVKENYELLSNSLPILDSYSEGNLDILKREIKKSKKELIRIYNEIQHIKSKFN